MDQIQRTLLEEVADLHGVPAGAYNIRANGQMAGRNTTANIDIITKEDKSGIDIRIKEGTKNESVHIPVVLSQSGMTEMVYNDFYIGDNAVIENCIVESRGTIEANACYKAEPGDIRIVVEKKDRFII